MSAGASEVKEGDVESKIESWALKIKLERDQSCLFIHPPPPHFPLTDLDICPLLSFLCEPCAKREQGYPAVPQLTGGAVEW